MTIDLIGSLDKQMSRKGILLIVWGWVLAVRLTIDYLVKATVLSFEVEDFFNLLGYSLVPIGIIITIVYLYKKKDRTRSAEGRLVSFIWASMLLSMVLVNLIQYNVNGLVNFEFQHPVFIVIIGASISITGKVLDYRSVMLGGVLFALLGYIASYFPLSEQMIIEALGWLVAFIIPGYIVYYERYGTNDSD